MIGNMIKDVRSTELERFQMAMSAVPTDSALWLLFPNGF